MSSLNQISGVILAGGQSRRFGGGDKGLLDLGGRPVLAHVIDRMQPQVGRLILNANGDISRFARFGLEIISDGHHHPRQGPLSGVLAALEWAEQHAHGGALATVSTDVPFLPLDLVERLDAARRDGVAIAASAGRRHPTIGLWPVNVRDAVAEALRRGDLSVDRLATKLKAVVVSFPMREIDGQALDPFFNVNTPDDLAAARILLAKCSER